MAGPRYVVRELRAEEWDRLLTMPPFRDMGRVTLSPASDAVVAVEEPTTGRLLGYWLGWWAFHVEPLWLEPEVRGNGSVIRRLWAAVQRMLQTRRIDTAFAIIHPGNPASGYAQRLGFLPAPGMAYFYRHPCVKVGGSAATEPLVDVEAPGEAEAAS